MGQKSRARVIGARTAFAALLGVPAVLVFADPALPGRDVDYPGLGVVVMITLGLGVGLGLTTSPRLEEAGTGVVRGSLGALAFYLGCLLALWLVASAMGD